MEMGRPIQCGTWFKNSGSSTKKAAPKMLPTMEPRPPMMIMNSSCSDWFRPKAAGSHEPRCTKPHSAPAMPTIKELTAKAESLAYTGRMPITLAATSISRMAIHSRPTELRTRFLAPSASTHKMARHSKYFSMGVSICQPRISSALALTEPEEELFVTQAARVVIQSIKNWAASVATARYRPRMRKLGRPNTTPTTMAHRPPPIRAMSRGMFSNRA